jgi:2-succinyl-6-hydroxy-2,4-cyclohexadiene-1-carboxylate synthase
MKLTCDGVQLEVSVFGSGDPLLILHGFTGSASAMQPLTERLTGRRIIPDLVGHGESESPSSLRPYSLSSISKQLAALLTQLDTHPVHVVGYSLGGRIALTLAISHPTMIRSLALIGASPGIVDNDERFQRLNSDRCLANSIAQKGIVDFVDNWVALPMWRSLRECLTPEQWAVSLHQRRSSHALGLANSLRASGAGAMSPLQEKLNDLEVPTLLIAGENDQKFRDIAGEIAAKLPQGICHVISESGHATHLEQPDATAAAILEHFRC